MKGYGKVALIDDMSKRAFRSIIGTLKRFLYTLAFGVVVAETMAQKIAERIRNKFNRRGKYEK